MRASLPLPDLSNPLSVLSVIAAGLADRGLLLNPEPTEVFASVDGGYARSTYAVVNDHVEIQIAVFDPDLTDSSAREWDAIVSFESDRDAFDKASETGDAVIDVVDAIDAVLSAPAGA